MSGFWSSIEFPDFPRRELRARMVAAGIPEQHVDEVVDLACHGADCAVTKLLETVEVSHNECVRITALGPAISFAIHRLQSIEEGLLAAANATGTKVSIETVAAADS